MNTPVTASSHTHEERKAKIFFSEYIIDFLCRMLSTNFLQHLSSLVKSTIDLLSTMSKNARKRENDREFDSISTLIVGEEEGEMGVGSCLLI